MKEKTELTSIGSCCIGKEGWVSDQGFLTVRREHIGIPCVLNECLITTAFGLGGYHIKSKPGISMSIEICELIDHDHVVMFVGHKIKDSSSVSDRVSQINSLSSDCFALRWHKKIFPFFPVTLRFSTQDKSRSFHSISCHLALSIFI